MKKIIIGFIISLFIVNSCRIGTEYVKWEADKSEIDYKAQTVTIRIKKELGMNPDFNQRFYVSKPFHIEAVTYDTKKKPGKATWYINGPWFKVTIPPNPVKTIEVEFFEKDSGEKRVMILNASGPYYGSCSITQNPK